MTGTLNPDDFHRLPSAAQLSWLGHALNKRNRRYDAPLKPSAGDGTGHAAALMQIERDREGI